MNHMTLFFRYDILLLYLLLLTYSQRCKLSITFLKILNGDLLNWHDLKNGILEWGVDFRCRGSLSPKGTSATSVPASLRSHSQCLLCRGAGAEPPHRYRSSGVSAVPLFPLESRPFRSNQLVNEQIFRFEFQARISCFLVSELITRCFLFFSTDLLPLSVWISPKNKLMANWSITYLFLVLIANIFLHLSGLKRKA